MGSEMKFRLWQTGDFDKEELECATPKELFGMWCNYEGLCGYASTILDRLEECGFFVMENEEIKYTHNNGRGYVVECLRLNHMPFDSDGRHATGNEVCFENGEWLTEYEGDNYEYSVDCIYLDE